MLGRKSFRGQRRGGGRSGPARGGSLAALAVPLCRWSASACGASGLKRRAPPSAPCGARRKPNLKRHEMKGRTAKLLADSVSESVFLCLYMCMRRRSFYGILPECKGTSVTYAISSIYKSCGYRTLLAKL